VARRGTEETVERRGMLVGVGDWDEGAARPVCGPCEGMNG
jgi:hypothetical protein